MVCLDLSSADTSLIEASCDIAKKVGAENIYLIHVTESLILPDEILQKYPDLIAPVDENIKRMIEQRLESLEEKLPFAYEIDVVDGDPAEKILKWSKIKEIDLIIMGKKEEKNGSGVLPEKIVKVCHCSLLLIPEKVQEINSILVPVDFSDSSKMAMEQALFMSKISGYKITCVHLYHVPTGYHSTGKSYEEFGEIMKKNAKNEYRTFITALDHTSDEIPCIHILVEHESSVKQVLQVAADLGSDLILMGSMGRSGLSSMLLGSHAMKMIKYNTDLPLMIVKDKTKNMGFLDAILRL